MLKRILTNQSGSMVMGIIFGGCVLAALTYLWNITQQGEKANNMYAHSLALDSISENIINRVIHNINNKNISYQCPNLTDLKNFREPNYSYILKKDNGAIFTDVPRCFLTSDEKKKLKKFELEIKTIGEPVYNEYYRLVTVVVYLESTESRKKKKIANLKIIINSLSNNTVVFKDDFNLTRENDNKVNFDSDVLVSSKIGIPVSDLIGGGISGKINYNKKLFTRAANLVMDLDVDHYEAGTWIDHFKGGIEFNYLHNAIKMPFDQTSGDLPDAWDIKFDYEKIYQKLLYPLVQIGSGTMAVTPYVGELPSLFYSETVSKFVKSNDASSILGVGKNIEYTCAASMGHSKTLVYPQKSKNLTIDFSTIKNWTDDVTDRPIFCGLVNVDELIIKTSNDAEASSTTYVLIGMFYVNKITIKGKGNIRFVNPYNFANLPADVTTNLSSSFFMDVIKSFATQSVNVGANFFLPVCSSINGCSLSFKPKNFNTKTEPCGSYKCWKGQVDAVETTASSMPNNNNFFVIVEKVDI